MAQPLTDSINALTRYANSVTGQSDTTLSEAVATLANGYGQGGGFSADDIASRNISGAITLTLSGNQYLGNFAFANTQITSVSAPTLVHGYSNCFESCENLITADLPMFHETDSRYAANMFRWCKALKTINMPYAKQGCTFDGCTSLISYTNKRPASETNNSGFSSYQFRDCSSLTVIDYTYLSQFGAQVGWRNTNNLGTVVLRRTDAIVPINNINNAPIRMLENGAGITLYVPSALISSYQSATNWSTILGYANNQILPIEGSIYETQYADGTPIE